MDAFVCWVCGSNELTFARASTIVGPLSGASFAVTDSNYGVTGELHRCSRCGFVQGSRLDEVLQFYEDLEDPSYEAGRLERRLQFAKLMDLVQRYQPTGRLLDVGAASGILVEVAQARGYAAVGVEPSQWLQARARERGLPVLLGSFPHPDITGTFDVVTLVDVIEHVSDPVALLRAAGAALSANGVGVVTTPDVGSLAARVLGRKWWHYRVAHIGYFDRRSLGFALERAGLRPVAWRRPSWFFRLSYILERVNRYTPKYVELSCPRLLSTTVVPLNLLDSLLVVFARA